MVVKCTGKTSSPADLGVRLQPVSPKRLVLETGISSVPLSDP